MRFTRLFSRPTYTAALACLLLSGLAACSNTVPPSQTTSEGNNTADLTAGTPSDSTSDANAGSSNERDSNVSNFQGEDVPDFHGDEADFNDEHGGRPSADLPYGPDAHELSDGTITVRNQEVSFNSGEISTVVSDAVVRGERNVYRLTAQDGQRMSLSISALEDNAVFQVLDPTGIGLTNEVTEDSFVLPETGEYTIIVGGTRGNASYDLSIEINERDFHGDEADFNDEHGGRPSADLPYGPDAHELTDGTITVRNLEVSFSPGESSTVVSDAVVRGERNVHRFTAQSGQQITLSLNALEDNAVFQVLDPTGIGLTNEVTEDSFVLPDAGEYTIVVGGTRGNAAYELDIAIN